MRKFLSLVLALAMTMSLVVINTSAKEFTDDDELNYDEAVAVISEIGVVDGYADGSFNPQGGLTRGAAAKIICNLILGPTTAAELHADTRPFPDVAVDSEFAGYIAYCAQQGIISGYADGEFKAANPLTGYAFMKMLLGALGYDSNTEGYVGENWSIQVAKQALGIGLNKGLVDTFNGVDYVTREEAALYAFNTLQATLVDYENKITANVNGAEVTISNGNAYPVGWDNQNIQTGIVNDGNIKSDNFVQFAEEYFPKLERVDDDTKFMEPANTWLYDRIEIGTFERKDLIVETYTTGVSGRDFYDLLKPGVIDTNKLAVYVDGIDAKGDGTIAAVGGHGEIARFDKDDLVRSRTDDLGATGNGVLTKVYLDTDKKLITIVSINTYLSQAVTNYSEESEYATLKVYTDINANKKAVPANYNVDVVDVENVVDVTKDSFYQVNISWRDEDLGEVVILNDVEILEDSTISEYSSSDANANVTLDGKVTKLTTGGTEYEANAKAFYDDEILYRYNTSLLTDATYNVYLDQYGYFLGVDLFEGTKNYVFITGFDRNTSNLSVKTATATGIFLDGTMGNIEVNVTDTDKNIDKARNNSNNNPATDNSELFVEWAKYDYIPYETTTPNPQNPWTAIDKHGDNGIFNLNQWYTYTVNEAGVYTLKPAVRMTWTAYPVNNAEDTIIRTDNLSLQDRFPAGVDTTKVTPGTPRVYGEDATVFLTVDLDTVDTSNGARAITEVNGVYTGVQNVDIIVDTKDPKATEMGQVYTVYDSDGYAIAAVVIGEAQGATGNYAYILSQAKSEKLEDGVYYWTFDAILDGTKQTLTARSSYENTIDNLYKGAVVELRFDGDYVVNAKQVAQADMYLNYLANDITDYNVYYMSDRNNTMGNWSNTDPQSVTLQGHTLYITTDRSDVGLGVLRDEAKAVVIQKENNKEVIREFSDVATAISYLGDADKTTTDIKDYDGVIMAVLNSRGAAEWIVFDSDTPVNTGSSGGFTDDGDSNTLPATSDMAVSVTGGGAIDGQGRYDASAHKLYLQFYNLETQASKVTLKNVQVSDSYGATRYIDIPLTIAANKDLNNQTSNVYVLDFTTTQFPDNYIVANSIKVDLSNSTAVVDEWYVKYVAGDANTVFAKTQDTVANTVGSTIKFTMGLPEGAMNVKYKYDVTGAVKQGSNTALNAAAITEPTEFTVVFDDTVDIAKKPMLQVSVDSSLVVTTPATGGGFVPSPGDSKGYAIQAAMNAAGIVSTVNGNQITVRGWTKESVENLDPMYVTALTGSGEVGSTGLWAGVRFDAPKAADGTVATLTEYYLDDMTANRVGQGDQKADYNSTSGVLYEWFKIADVSGGTVSNVVTTSAYHTVKLVWTFNDGQPNEVNIEQTYNLVIG